MADTVTIEFAHPHGDHAVGDRDVVDPATAKRLVRAGVANYATKTDAVAVEGDAGAAKTARARKSKK